MKDEQMERIGRNLYGFQAALRESGLGLQQYLEKYYCKKWGDETLYHAMALRTTFVKAMHNFLVEEGLFNIERLQLSPLTDPLAHDVESVPSIQYKGQTYVTTHSMIYAKFLACLNPEIKGIFVDSPNIRLELESPDMTQRGKYLIDFSQMDIEMRRNRGIDYETYLKDPKKVQEMLREDMEKILDFFERMIIYAVSEMKDKNEHDLEKLGVALEVPSKAFPRFKCDESKKKYGAGYEIKLGEEASSQFFWITGLLRENYDLVYPYLTPNGKVNLSEVTSDMIYNYDICAKSIDRKTGKQSPALEIMSGAIREWLFEPIVERLVDNGVIPARPIFSNGNIENIDELGGYGPFLMVAKLGDDNKEFSFPDTFGGGVGIERALYAITRGPKTNKIDDITYFGKNPDSHQVYLF